MAETKTIDLVSEENFDAAVSELKNDLTDISHESSTSGSSKYIKYADGTLICSGRFRLITKNSTSTGILPVFEYANLSSELMTGSCNFAHSFASKPDVSISNTRSEIQGIVADCECSVNGITRINIVRYTSGSTVYGPELSYVAIGRWK